jgi:PPM family protein phosphatase
VDLVVRAGTRRSKTHDRNQDRVVLGSTVVGDDPQVIDDRLGGPALIAVLDGLGGHRAGDVASELAGRRFAEAQVPEDEDGVTALLNDADRLLHDTALGDPRYEGMGTTAAMLAFGADGHEALVASVGDSTVWRLNAEGLHQLSVSDRAFGSTILQCLGASSLGVEPHVKRIEVRDGDRILLASDGLTDVIDTDTIAALLRDGSEAVERLIETVEAAGPPDDVTVVVVDVLGVSPA